jgi:hypothetical protein
MQNKFSPPFGSNSLHGALHQSNCANFISNPYCEIYIKFIVIILFYFHSPKKHLEFFKLAELMKGK